MKNTIYFESEWLDNIKELPVADQNELLAAVMRYQITGELPELPMLLKAIFMFIKLQLDRRRERLDKKRKSKSVADETCVAESTTENRSDGEGCSSPSAVEKQKPEDAPKHNSPRPDNGIGNLLAAVLENARKRESCADNIPKPGNISTAKPVRKN